MHVPYLFALHEPKNDFTAKVLEQHPGELIAISSKDKLYGDYSESMRDVALAK